MNALLLLGGSALAYALVCLYGYLSRTVFSDFELSISTEKTQRRIARNIIGLVRMGVDVAIILWTKNQGRGEIYKPLLFYAFTALLVLHFINSVFALLRWGKAYKTVDIVAYFVKLLTGLAILGILIFFERGTTVMFFADLASLAILCTKGSNMLDGDWLELLQEDLQKY